MTILLNKETHWVISHNSKRKLFIKNYLIKNLYRINKSIGRTPKILKIYCKIRIQKFSYKSSICFINNRCLLSGRGYSIKSKYKLSRFFLRKNYNRLFVSGLRRASW